MSLWYSRYLQRWQELWVTRNDCVNLSARTHAGGGSMAGRRGFPRERPICRWFRESSEDLGLRLFLLLRGIVE